MNQKGSVTIKTIADELGISFSTVSKALNNNPVIKFETRQLVMAKAKEMGYSPNMSAKSLRSRVTHSIGMILNDLENPTLAHILCTITHDMADLGYTTLICDSRYNEKTELQNIQTVISRNTDAIIIEPVTTDAKALKYLRSMMKNVILLSDTIRGFNSNCVHVDYHLGGYLAAKELILNGHTRNMIISEPDTTSVNKQYISGIRQAYTEYNLALDETLIQHCVPSLSNGCQVVLNHKALLDHQKPNRITGFLCICDSLAYGVYKATSKLGLSIPNDISVIGFDDYYPSEFFTPPLTSVYLPKERMARSCSTSLREILSGTQTGTRTVSLEPYLISRGSVFNRLTIQ